MKPKYVIYECENCGKEFYREVEEVITDDAELCEVKVKLLQEADSEDIEEFPMCGCLGGDPDYVIDQLPSDDTEE